MQHLKKFLAISAIGLLAAACSSTSSNSGPSAADTAKAKAASNQVYSPKNHVELDNYNKRQQVADDPTTILWCTFAFPIPGSPLVTIPIVGKLTSGAKRPFPEHQNVFMSNNQGPSSFSPDVPGADGMYGSSGDYRYGFTPEQSYADFYNLATFCTTAPMIWQKEKTTIALSVDPSLASAAKTAQAQLKSGDKSAASSTLKGAIAQAGGK